MTAPDPAAPAGLVVVDKAGGMTSHDVVAKVRRLAGTRKVGHAGTLDPMATGVLLLGVNRATRLLGHLMLTEKAYDATVLLGVGTTTDDAEGEVVSTASTAHLAEDDVRSAAGAFVGDIEQVPSSVSAIKVDGQRAYKRVRAGEDVELPSRPVTVHELLVTGYRPTDAGVEVDISVRCSSGTYIRAIARDLGAALGVGGHLTALRRTAVGPFDLADAHTLEELAEDFRLVDITDVARRCFPGLDLDEQQAADVMVGRKLDVDLGAEGRGRGVRPRRPLPRALRAPRRPGRTGRRPDLTRTPRFVCDRPAGRGERIADESGCGRLATVTDTWRSLDEVPADLGRTVVTIGNFDGVHLGHRHVIARAREVAAGAPVVAVTFDPHPIAVLRPEHAPPTLTTVDTRVGLLAEAGVDHVLVLPFTREVAGWSPERFVTEILVDALHAQAVVVGANFRFGNRAAGDVATLRTLGETHDFTAEGIDLDGGPQVWSSTYIRNCLTGGDVEGAAEALGRPFTGGRHGRQGRPARPRARLPDGQRADHRHARRSRRRRLRRLAAPPRRARRGAARGDQRRHQPDLRRRARATGGVLRARSQRPRALRRGGRGQLRGPDPRHAALLLGGGAAGGDGRRLRPCPGPARGARPLMTVADDAAARDAEAWFVRHGLPYFVDDQRDAVRRGLTRARLLPVLGLAVLVGAAAGVLWGLLVPADHGGGVAGGIPVGLLGLGTVLAVYAGTTLRFRPIARWAVAQTLGSLGLLFPLVTRALPLLLLFVTFLFINTEVWQLATHLDAGVLALAVMFFALLAVGFLLVRLPEELDRVDDDLHGERLVAICRGTPMESVAAEVADRVDHRRHVEVTGFEKANLILVLLVSQFVQVLLLSLAVLGFFLVFGSVVMQDEVVKAWISPAPTRSSAG